MLRSTDEKFTRPAERWLARLGQELAPLLSDRGGPIIAVQLENEYGSFDKDKAYLQWHRRALLDGGFGGALIYVPADWIKPAEGGVERLMNVYVSMGVTPPVAKPVLADGSKVSAKAPEASKKPPRKRKRERIGEDAS